MNENALAKLPKGWVWTRLGEICLDPQYGWTTSAITEGALHLLRTTDITSGNIDWNTVPFCKEEPSEKAKYFLKHGDIVISRAGSVGYSCLIRNPKQAIFASYLIRFRPLVDETYLAFFLKSPLYWDSISEKSLGIAIPNVNASKLKQIQVPLPPLPEQHRIAAKIEELFTKLDAGVEALKKAKKQIKRYQQSVLKYAFEGKLTEEWRKANRHKLESASVLLERIKEEQKKKLGKKYRELSPVDQSELPELPEGWVWVRLGEISDIIMGQSPPSSTYNVNKTGLPFYQGKLDFGEIYPTPRVWCSKPQKTAESGDIFLSVRAPVGPTNICNEKCCIGRGLAVVRYFYRNENKFIFYFFRSIENQIPKIGTGSTFSAISKSQIENLLFPLPPLPEQHRIVEEIERRLSIADATEKIIDQCLKQAERLRQSILKTAFEGKLVPQDPNDEPAEKLLERIKVEKEKQSKIARSNFSNKYNRNRKK